MAAPFGNKNGLGNKGGRRPAVKEEIWHKEKWENDSKVRELEAKIASGVYSVRDVYLLRALKADVAILKNMADKVLANLIDIRGRDGGPIETASTNSEIEALGAEYEEKLKATILGTVTYTIPSGSNTTSMPGNESNDETSV